MLYFGYKHEWSKSKSILERIAVPDYLKPYVSDYKINIFDLAFLSDEKALMFKSDFRFMVDYLKQMRKTGTYTGNTYDITHLKESLSLMTAITDDDRFIKSYHSLKKKRRVNMCTVLDEIEERGIEKGQDEVLAVYDWLLKNNRIDDVKRASHDKAFYESLLIEYNNSRKKS